MRVHNLYGVFEKHNAPDKERMPLKTFIGVGGYHGKFYEYIAPTVMTITKSDKFKIELDFNFLFDNKEFKQTKKTGLSVKLNYEV